MEKKGDFGTIVAVIGAILIALGFAWLIAQNWHYFSAPMKIIILAALTGASFTIGYFMEEKYERIARSLYVLGNLLFILSVFLIAQVFHLSLNPQTTANILLICLAGVAFSSYYFGSYTSLIITFGVFLFWMNFQFFALNPVYVGSGPNLAIYLILNLAAGVLFQGLSWLHQARDHTFGKLYNWWALFYFLVFTYVLSFQSFIPLIWQEPINYASGQAIFAGIAALLAIAAFSAGLIKAIDFTWKKAGLIAVILVLLAFIFVSKFAYSKGSITSTYGYCVEPSCTDFSDETSCLSAYNCDWQNNACDYERFSTATKYCALKYDLKGAPKCDAGCTLQVTPINVTADESVIACVANCADFTSKNDCRSYPDCTWLSNSCKTRAHETGKAIPAGVAEKPEGCYDFANETDCKAQTGCKWQVSEQITGKNAPPGVWIFWVAVNVLFILMILGVIGLGSYERSATIINLGIVAFVIDIISRYIGFMMDFWGYTSLSVIFIIGGVLLIGGGWLVEKWRRKLVDQIKVRK